MLKTHKNMVLPSTSVGFWVSAVPTVGLLVGSVRVPPPSTWPSGENVGAPVPRDAMVTNEGPCCLVEVVLPLTGQ